MENSEIRLIAFDLSNTLIDGSFLVSAANLRGNGEKAREHFESYSRGEIPGEKLIEKCAPLLKGLSIKDDFPRLHDLIGLSKGVVPTLEWLEQNRIKIAILSAASQRFCEFIGSKLGIDCIYGTEYEVKGGVFTGGIDKMYMKKEDSLRDLMQKFNLKAEECAAVGDSTVDVGMLKLAGIGIGFNPNPLLAKEADYSITDFRELIGIIKPGGGL